MSQQIKPFDVVALLTDNAAHGLARGQVGTVVEELKPGVYEVEFSDNDGQTYAQCALPAKDLLVLRHESALKA
jgi:hypothetical protein